MVQLTPDNSKQVKGNFKMFKLSGVASYQKMETNGQNKGIKWYIACVLQYYSKSVHFSQVYYGQRVNRKRIFANKIKHNLCNGFRENTGKTK